MASRRSPATVGLFCQVLKVLVLLGWGQQMSALCVQLTCLYVCGLIVLDKHQTHCRIARFLPARCHDALNRLLRKMAFSTDGWLVCGGVVGALADGAGDRGGHAVALGSACGL